MCNLYYNLCIIYVILNLIKKIKIQVKIYFKNLFSIKTIIYFNYFLLLLNFFNYKRDYKRDFFNYKRDRILMFLKFLIL